MVKVFLDAGHGGHDPGAVGNNMLEKDIALEVTLKIGSILKQHGVEVGYSRTTDVFVELHERAKQANSYNADVFVSIHCNSFDNLNASGTESYHFTNIKSGGDILAKDIHNSIISDKLYTKDRGVKSADFAVLRLTRMKSCLVELAFISNKDDASILLHKQNELAETIAKGILKNLGIKYQDANSKGSESKLEGQNKVKIKVDGKLIEVDGYLEKGINYVQVREVFEKLGHKVSWDNKDRVVIIE